MLLNYNRKRRTHFPSHGIKIEIKIANKWQILIVGEIFTLICVEQIWPLKVYFTNEQYKL